MRNIEVVELLLDKGAKVSAVDKVKHLCRENTFWKTVGRPIYLLDSRESGFILWRERLLAGAVCVGFWSYDIFLAVLIVC